MTAFRIPHQPIEHLTNMPIREDFLGMLRCPLTRRPLERAGAVLLARLNHLAEDNALQNQAGELVQGPLEEGLVEPLDGWFYAIYDNIPALLKDEAIAIREIIAAIKESPT